VGGRDNGFRMTKARAAILDELDRSSNHPTADELHRSLRRRLDGVSLATVYRGVDALAREGRIRVIEAPGGPRRFDRTMTDHYHVVCQSCGRVGDVGLRVSAPLESAVLGARGFRVLGHRLCFTGLCPVCVDKGKAAKRLKDGRRDR
jgi:Fur family transcriptional regulator, peroxide stress response regulator